MHSKKFKKSFTIISKLLFCLSLLFASATHSLAATPAGYSEYYIPGEENILGQVWADIGAAGPVALNAARHTYFLVTGSEKAAALDHVLQPTADVHTYPAAGIRTADDGPVWWVDREAIASYRPRS